jgi:hypothetical protein
MVAQSCLSVSRIDGQFVFMSHYDRNLHWKLKRDEHTFRTAKGVVGTHICGSAECKGGDTKLCAAHAFHDEETLKGYKARCDECEGKAPDNLCPVHREADMMAKFEHAYHAHIDAQRSDNLGGGAQRSEPVDMHVEAEVPDFGVSKKRKADEQTEYYVNRIHGIVGGDKCKSFMMQFHTLKSGIKTLLLKDYQQQVRIHTLEELIKDLEEEAKDAHMDSDTIFTQFLDDLTTFGKEHSGEIKAQTDQLTMLRYNGCSQTDYLAEGFRLLGVSLD